MKVHNLGKTYPWERFLTELHWLLLKWLPWRHNLPHYTFCALFSWYWNGYTAYSVNECRNSVSLIHCCSSAAIKRTMSDPVQTAWYNLVLRYRRPTIFHELGRMVHHGLHNYKCCWGCAIWHSMVDSNTRCPTPVHTISAFQLVDEDTSDNCDLNCDFNCDNCCLGTSCRT